MAKKIPIGRVRGSYIRTGNGSPSDFTGWLEGDLYIDNQIYEVYKYTNNTLKSIANIKGKDGYQDFLIDNEGNLILNYAGTQVADYSINSNGELIVQIAGSSKNLGKVRYKYDDGKLSINIKDVKFKNSKVLMLDSDNNLTFDGEKVLLEKDKNQIQEMIKNIKALSFKIVEELPTEDIAENIIYLVVNYNSSDPNLYDEYIYTEGEWERLGTTQIDLGKYQPKLTAGEGLTINEDNVISISYANGDDLTYGD